MGSKSNEFETLILNHLFGGAAYGQPTLYVALTTGALTETCTGGTLASEVSGGAYARKQCDTWSVSGGTSSNGVAVTFVQATAAWGTIDCFAICDHLTTGNVLYYGTLTTSKMIGTSDQAKFATDDIDVTEA